MIRINPVTGSLVREYQGIRFELGIMEASDILKIPLLENRHFSIENLV